MPFDAGGPVTDYKRDVGKGWGPLLDELDAALKEVQPNYETFQVKEKFGWLRVYLRETTEAAQDVISAFEKRSGEICERCGAPGTTKARPHWMNTLCEPCGELFVKDRKTFWQESDGR